MATYTGLADANGDFTVPFSSNYTSGEKITVKAEKDGAEKTIQLYAPSEISGGTISFGGSLTDFPQNITSVTISQILGSIANEAFKGPSYATEETFQTKATSLIIDCQITRIGNLAFANWASIQSINFPGTLVEIGSLAFSGCGALTRLVIPSSVSTIDYDAFNSCGSILSVSIGTGIKSIGDSAFAYLSNAVSVTCHAITPPTISSSTFTGIKSTVKYYVPAASLAAYKAAPIWKTFASKIYAIA